MDTKKIIYSLLKEIKDTQKGEAILQEQDFDLTKDQFGDIVEMMLEEKYIKGANVIRGGIGSHVQAVWTKDAKITLLGEDFLEQNSILAKTYRGLKEVRDWLKL